MSVVDKKQSLAEQLAELSNPKPAIFPEDVTLEADAAKVCDFDEYEAIDVTPPVRTSTRRSRSDACLDEDPRYAGRAISRKDLEEFEDGELFVLGMGFYFCAWEAWVLRNTKIICTSQDCMMVVMHSWHGRI